MSLRIILLLFFIIILMACHDESDHHQVSVQTQRINNALYFTGVIRPLKTVVIPSPADSVILEMPFQYGATVEKGQLLFVLSSNKFLTDYKATLTQYIKAKNDFNITKTQLAEAEFLHKNLLISEDDFKMKQSTFYSHRLMLLQAKDALEALTKQVAIKNVNFEELSIADFDKITQVMSLQLNAENLKVLSPSAGIVLFINKNDEESRRMNKGDMVKQGDVLALIGDTNAFSISIKVNELTVNQLKAGQKVKITGIAFPYEVLTGEIIRIDHQGEMNNGLPVFSVEIVIPRLTTAQQQMIHIGMSAKVEINRQEPLQILIPLTAVKEKNGETFVELYDKKNDKKREVPIKTGTTQMDTVTVLAGLKEGDIIVLPD